MWIRDFVWIIHLLLCFHLYKHQDQRQYVQQSSLNVQTFFTYTQGAILSVKVYILKKDDGT